MKIGILTYHSVYNFGANLQAYSTYSYLINNGHNPIIIDYLPIDLENAFNTSVSKEQINAHKKFVNTHFTLTNRCHNSKEIAQEIRSNQINAIIIGSDAVVQHMPFLSRIRISPSRRKILNIQLLPKKEETNFPNPFWGEFVSLIGHEIPIAYMSVSSQNTDYRYFTGKTKKQIFDIVKKFSYVSVRDTRTKKMFESVSNRKLSPVVTPDPVFAFNKNIINQPTKEEILTKYNLPKDYILLSFNSNSSVNSNWVKEFRDKAQKIGITCAALPMPGKLLYSTELEFSINLPLDPVDWYCLIKYSKGYIGEKMHPIIVALHNSVPFYSFDHYGITRFWLFVEHKASKIFDILSSSGFLQNRVSIRNKIKYHQPSTQTVLDAILNFDKIKCRTFANQMVNNYNQMMIDILKSFNH